MYASKSTVQINLMHRFIKGYLLHNNYYDHDQGQIQGWGIQGTSPLQAQ